MAMSEQEWQDTFYPERGSAGIPTVPDGYLDNANPYPLASSPYTTGDPFGDYDDYDNACAE